MKKPIWNTIAIPVGKMSGHPAGEFTLDQKCFEEIVRNYTEDGIDLPCDFFHASEGNSAAKDRGDFVPSGWIKGVKIENGNLMALVDWTYKASQQIINGDLRFLSPAIRWSSKHPKTGLDRGAVLSSVALCLKPFLRQLPEARAMSDHGDTAIQMSEVAINAAELAELSSDEPEEMILLTEHQVQLADAVAQAVAPLSLELKSAQVLLADTEAERDVAAAQVIALEARVKLMQDQADDALIEERYQIHREARKLGPHSKKVIRALLSDRALLDSEFPALPNNAPPWLTRKLSEDNSGSAALAGIKTVAPLSEIIKSTIEANPGRDYDSNFTAALSQYNTALAQGMMH